MLCGIFIVSFDLFDNDAIPGFGFQDVIEMLQPENFLDCLNRYSSLPHLGCSAAGWVHTKMSRHCSRADLEEHRQFFIDAFSTVSNKGITVSGSLTDTIFDRALSCLINSYVS